MTNLGFKILIFIFWMSKLLKDTPKHNILENNFQNAAPCIKHKKQITLQACNYILYDHQLIDKHGSKFSGVLKELTFAAHVGKCFATFFVVILHLLYLMSLLYLVLPSSCHDKTSSNTSQLLCTLPAWTGSTAELKCMSALVLHQSDLTTPQSMDLFIIFVTGEGKKY